MSVKAAPQQVRRDRDPSDRPVRRRAAASALVSAMALGGLSGLGWWGGLNPGNFVWVERLFDHVFLFGVAAALLAGWGLCLLTRRRRLRATIWLLCAPAAALWGLEGIAWAYTFGGSEVVAQVPAPGRPYEAVVYAESWNIPDPAWTISVRQTGKLTAREFEVRCLDGGHPHFNFRKVSWLDDAHLLVKFTRQPSEIVLVDPITGELSRVSSKAWNC